MMGFAKLHRFLYVLSPRARSTLQTRTASRKFKMNRARETDLSCQLAPAALAASIGASAFLAWKYNPDITKGFTTTGPGDFMKNLLTHDIVRGAFAIGGISRLIFFNIRDEIALSMNRDVNKVVKAEDTCCRQGKPMMMAAMMNAMACILTPARAIYFCSWSAGWEAAEVVRLLVWNTAHA